VTAPPLPTGEQWRNLVDDLHEAVVAADTTNTVVYVNTAAESLLGWSAQELIGQPLTAIMPERFRAQHVAGFDRFLRSGEATVMGVPLRVPALRPDGSEIAIELVVSRAHLPGGTLLIGLLRDMSERLELEGLGELTQALVSALTEAPTLAEAIPRVLAGVGQSLNWDLVQLWLLDGRGTLLRRRATWSTDDDVAATFIAARDEGFERGVGLPGRVWSTAAPAWIEDVSTDDGFARAAAAATTNLRAAFAFPLVSDDRVVGVIEMLSTQAHGISDDLVQRMRTLGHELGRFIERRVAEEERLSLLEAEREARAAAERARSRLAYLGEASTVLGASLDLDVILERIASLAVPALGDWCVIHLAEDGAVRVAAVAHEDAARIALLKAVHEDYPVDIDARDGVGSVLRTGELIRHDDVTDEVLERIARDERHLSLLRRLAFGALVTVPLQAAGGPIGAVTVATERGVALSDDTVATVVELARRAAMAIDNARLHRDVQLQAALLRTRGEAGLEGQLVVGPTGAMVSFNRRFAEMWNIPDDVLLLRSDAAALDVAATQVVDPDGFLSRAAHLLGTRQPGRDQLHLLDGRVFDRIGAPLDEGGVDLGYAWYFRDVTDHKQIERDLADTAARSDALARTLQQSLIPPALPQIPGLDLAARYLPAHGVDVGGDFYDVYRIGRGTWGAVLGDVCGHGAEAAAITAFARYTIRAAAAQTRSPARALRLLNDAMLRQAQDGGPGRFVTVANARIVPGRGATKVTIAIGGHPLPLVRRASGATAVVGSPGTVVGILSTVHFHDVELELLPRDCMVFVTDGVLEARRGREQFGERRLVDLIAATHATSPGTMADAIVEAVREHASAGIEDDLAVLVLAVPAARAADHGRIATGTRAGRVPAP